MEGERLDAVGHALRKCPFLHSVSAIEGEGFARRLVSTPAAAAPPAGLVFPEDTSFFQTATQLFHGAGGVVPLQRFSADAQGAAAQGCPYAKQMLAQPASAGVDAGDRPAYAAAGPALGRGAAAPMAAISLGGFGSLVSSGQLEREGAWRSRGAGRLAVWRPCIASSSASY